MSHFDLRRANLNYLIVFEILMAERHVGRAALRLGLTQSAVSHALGRLRETLNDPLFVRHPKGVEPTPRAMALAPRISQVLADASDILADPTQFDATRVHAFKIGATDGAINAVLIPLMAKLRREAPAISISVLPTGRDDVVPAIDRMEIDLAITVSSATIARLERSPITTLEFVAIVRRDHPCLSVPMTLETFAALPHIVVAPHGYTGEPIDEAFAAAGLKRNIVVVEPHYLAAPLMVARTDMVAIVDRTLANLFVDTQGLALFDPPVKPPRTTLDILISKARVTEPPLVWLQAQIRSLYPAN
ncbi:MULTISPECIES: LysR family transcriptional regulator [unclassified Beijerinckia]|uniref:LysR family transcriptional regulator n=1 Tax=unclassified Beijerinckia TaxID=2638183 RepID=UPI00089BCF68|nr:MULTISPECIES: LysR family transcriptional regulator [unclassified Beijerinckia]MDH7798362.1 DNA-binding transcriptional LysR family regulator [Beijerinckia sp. GAS462]SED18387.1 DNA-binding transcriptional regulator, LysR family [Beijerinckia sp. 28-YEA-48]